MLALPSPIEAGGNCRSIANLVGCPMRPMPGQECGERRALLKIGVVQRLVGVDAASREN